MTNPKPILDEQSKQNLLWEKFQPHSGIGSSIYCFEQLPSTMNVAWEWANHGGRHGTTILAQHQTAGRGRFKRNWYSNIGESLTISIIIRTEAVVAKQLSMIASLGVVTGIQRLTGLQPTIKWPNDVQWDGQKLCGILIESQINTNGKSTVVLGIGLNLALDLSNHPEIRDSTVSLSDLTHQPISPYNCLVQVLSGLDHHYQRTTNGINPVNEWQSVCNTIGKSVIAVGPEGSTEGIAQSIDQEGNLILLMENGTVTRLSAEEISLKRSL